MLVAALVYFHTERYPIHNASADPLRAAQGRFGAAQVVLERRAQGYDALGEHSAPNQSPVHTNGGAIDSSITPRAAAGLTHPAASARASGGMAAWWTWWWSLGLSLLVLTGGGTWSWFLGARLRSRYARALEAELAKRRLAEAELAVSEMRYRGVVEDEAMMIFRLNQDGTYTFANSAYARTFDRRPEELIGTTIWQVLPAREHAAARKLLDAITPESPVSTTERRVTARNGETRWHHFTDHGIFDRDGRLVEHQCLGLDVTDRVRAEEEHRQLVAQRMVEKALRLADRRKNDFLATLAHELRNPLVPVAMAAEILRASPPSDRRMAWARDVIARQAKHMMRLVDDLLDVSRITRGKVLLHKEVVDLRVVAEQAVESIQPLVDRRGHTLTLSVPDEPLDVDGDPARLAQIFSNLLDNAAKYSERGGTIELELRRDHRGGDHALVLVRDTGVGISAEMLSRIFDPFMQIDDTRGRAEGGLGIGLSLVKRLVELHGGTVHAWSAGLGLGSEFSLRLPAVSSRALASGSAVRPSDEHGVAMTHALRVLVVDDNVDAADSLAELLTIWGHTARVAYDGLGVVEAARQFAPDVVLIDLGLPSIAGEEVARRLRGGYEGAGPVLVAVTGRARAAERRRCAEAGFVHVLIKPVEPALLRDLLARVPARAVGPTSSLELH
jgi:PAS domain S-box-containing protein